MTPTVSARRTTRKKLLTEHRVRRLPMEETELKEALLKVSKANKKQRHSDEAKGISKQRWMLTWLLRRVAMREVGKVKLWRVKGFGKAQKNFLKHALEKLIGQRRAEYQEWRRGNSEDTTGTAPDCGVRAEPEARGAEWFEKHLSCLKGVSCSFGNMKKLL